MSKQIRIKHRVDCRAKTGLGNSFGEGLGEVFSYLIASYKMILPRLPTALSV